jgi:hypothetical protein
MSDLIKYERDKVMVAVRGDELREMFEANASTGVKFGASDLTTLKTPAGGGVFWEIPTATGESTSAKEVTGLMIHMQQVGTLWPSLEQNEEKKQRPVLRTNNRLIGWQVSPIPDHMAEHLAAAQLKDADGKPLDRQFDWQKMHYNQWKTGKNGKGKWAKDQIALWFVPLDGMMPYFIRIQPGSLKAMDDFIKSLVREAIPYTRAVVSFGLTKIPGPPAYAQVTPKLVGVVDRETEMAVRDSWGKQIRDYLNAPIEMFSGDDEDE